MNMTLGEAVALDAFKTFRLIAGEAGLKEPIVTVGMMDYEMGDMIEKNFREGELVLTTLVNIKDDLNRLGEIVERLIKVGAAGLAIKNIYIETIPEPIKKRCDEANFPIFVFHDVFFEVLITAVNDLVKTQLEMEDLEVQIDRMLSGEMNRFAVRRLVQQLYRYFGEYVQVAYAKSSETYSHEAVDLQRCLLDKSHKCWPYRGGFLVVVSGDEPESQPLLKHMERSLNQLQLDHDHVLGLSRGGQKIDRLDAAIHEAIYAYQTAVTYQLGKLNFSDMGLDRLLLPIKDNPWAVQYYESVIEPLQTYDQRQGAELLKTAVVYILSGGDVKLAAEKLFQHGNTVRYRMERVRQILSEGRDEQWHTEWSFYETLAVGVRLHLIYTGDL